MMDQSGKYFSIFLCFFWFFFNNSEGTNALALQNEDAGVEWDYLSVNGISSWTGICVTGVKQSPINIEIHNTVENSFPALQFGETYDTYLTLNAKNNGHTILVNTPNITLLPTFQGGRYAEKFIFEQMHFHWSSEHQIEGKRAALETHFLHYNSKYKNFDEALKKEDGLAVIAVLCDEVEESDSEIEKFLKNIIENLNHSPSTHGNNLEENEQSNEKKVGEFFTSKFKLRNFMPDNTKEWVSYDGSLTTPACYESVTWTILLNRMQVSNKTVNSLRKLRDHGGRELFQNYREIQLLNNRTIFLQADESANEIDNPDNKPNKANSKSTKCMCLVSVALIFCSNILYDYLFHKNKIVRFLI